MLKKYLNNKINKKLIEKTFNEPLMSLVSEASLTHRKNHLSNTIKICSLLSIKTGKCSQDCAYCPQSAHFKTEVEQETITDIDFVVNNAKKQKKRGATRFCLGAAWPKIPDNSYFQVILKMIEEVNKIGIKVCGTLGDLTLEQAKQLKQAGLYSYNHNLDTSENFYPKIITTRTYESRLQTFQILKQADIKVCSGGIIGMGETNNDIIDMIHTLANFPVDFEAIPINALIPIKGTPLENQPRVDIFRVIRTIATTRIINPKPRIVLAAGRATLSEAEQTLCFLAGANSLFLGEKLLTAKNNSLEADEKMFTMLDISSQNHR